MQIHLANRRRAALLAASLLPGLASVAAAADLPGEAMGAAWALPFVLLLLSIALGPLVAPRLWHRRYGMIAGGLALLAVAALAVAFGLSVALAAFAHAMLGEYLSFIALLAALYTVSGGILVAGDLRGTPAVNTAFLALGTAIASIVGTTGAAMILISPLLRANERRRHKAHIVVFFIILVGNIGGALTPLGDPPLFVGFLRGVDFFWTARHLWLQTAIVAIFVLILFVIVETFLYRREAGAPTGERGPAAAAPLSLRGGLNLLLIALIVVLIVATANLETGATVDIFGVDMPIEEILRDVGLLAIALLSLWLTPSEHRRENGFSWAPIREVAILFAAIFVAIIPVLAVLGAGRNGAFSPLLQLVTDAGGRPREAAYFWLTGGLSAFLDNAPTYLVFFELAGGDAEALMGPFAGTLASISMGAVYMGALTYVGNAPNMMVYAIAVERGVRMPGFFGYLLLAAIVLVPVFALITLLPIPPRLPSS
jgi:Na+/H+ antiporter NhaD/arsenite permease-like protein